MDMKCIRTDKRLCTCCMEEHEVKTVQVQKKSVFKDVSVSFWAEYLYCDAADELYADEEQLRENDIRMKDAYRMEQGLLTSGDICGIRAKYGISQSDLCALLGWGGKTITRYESHQVQDRAHDTILKKLDQDPEWFIRLLAEAKGSISAEAYQKYSGTAARLYEKNHDAYLRKAIQGMYAGFHGDEMYHGNAQLSLDKVVDVIRYYSNSPQMHYLYKVKLMKLLWYADFLAYKIRGRAITGLVYQALPMGAVPVGHDSIIHLAGVECEEVDMGDGTGYRFNASENREYQYLSDAETGILDQVVKELGRLTTNEIVAFMHREQAYQKTAPRDIIQFKYAESLLVSGRE